MTRKKKMLTEFPEVLAQWDYEKNGALDPATVTHASARVAWWICEAGHRWQEKVVDRTHLKKPICRVCELACKSVERQRPDLANEWHPTKNGVLTPSNVTSGSGKKIHWVCRINARHEWQASISSRVRGNGCPHCARENNKGPSRVIFKRSLAYLNPQLASEWHPSRNGDLRPDQIAYKSSAKVWWQCQINKEHEWESIISNRVGQRSGCPMCSGRDVTAENSLLSLHPELAEQWHPTKNGDLTPTNVTSGSGKKIHWVCQINSEHEWQASISSRVRGNGCPHCWKIKLKLKGPSKVRFQRSLAYLNPQLAVEWHPVRNGDLRPDQIAHKSGAKVWWLCKNNQEHEWNAAVYSRASGSGCPQCAKEKSKGPKHVEYEQSLAYLAPEIAASWHPTLNGELKPGHISPGCNLKVWWQCSRFPEHEWSAQISNRSQGKGCPKCTNQTSLPELRLLSEIRAIFPDAESRTKPVGKFEADIYISQFKIAVEYDGAYWHKGKASREKRKVSAFMNSGISIVRARQEPLPLVYPYDLTFPKGEIGKEDVDRLVSTLIGLVDSKIAKKRLKKYLKKDAFLNEEEYRLYQSYLPNPNPAESLAAKRPDLVESWDFKRNRPLTPHQFTPGSDKKVWWKCDKGEDHRWWVSVKDRCNHGCPYCSGSRPCKDNNLALNKPRLAKEWHPTRNLKSAQEVLTASSEKAWWTCSSCNYEYESRISNRAQLNRGCPMCAGMVVTAENCLSACYPDLAKQWHPHKNEELTPSDLKPGSAEKVWWLCEEGKHEWQAAVYSRVAGNGCSACYEANRGGPLKVGFERSLAFLEPEIASEWHPARNGDLRPDQIAHRSNSKVWWQCQINKEHEWKSIISNRVGQRSGCPHCAKEKGGGPKRVGLSESLSFLKPEIASEWHPSLNGELSADHVACKSNSKVWWLCKNNQEHEWHAVIASRVSGRGCPQCARERSKGPKHVEYEQSLAHLAPEIAASWHPTLNGELRPDQISPGCNSKVWWQCMLIETHKWQRAVNNMSQKRGGCPHCRKKNRKGPSKVSFERSLANLEPEFASEWHPARNGDLRPDQIAHKSGAKVWWQCQTNKEHEWESIIGNRVKLRSGCPHCRKEKSKRGR